MENRTIVAIGGGEIKAKTTLAIDEYIAALAKQRAGDRRANALFVGTASHDYMPYFNSFRKIYTSVFDIKADVAMTVFKQTEPARLEEKFLKADMIYVGGGDTRFMIEHWKTSGIDNLIRDAYQRGVIIAGLSAGAICWFEEMYTDSEIVSGQGFDYKLMPAMGWLKGLACPHYNERVADFDAVLKNRGGTAVCIENDCAIVYQNEAMVKTVSAGGKAYILNAQNDILVKTEV